MMYPFERYRKDKCDICLRRSRCMWKEGAPLISEGPLAMILCAQFSFFKGPGDENLLTEEEKESL